MPLLDAPRRPRTAPTAFLNRSTLRLAALGLLLTIAAAAPGRAEVIGVDDFRLETVDAELIYLDFWASWCPPCRVSFPWMKQLSERYGSRGLRVIAINVDRDPVAAERFLNQARPDFDIVRDPEGQLAATYDIAAMPSSFLLTPAGEILLRHEGFRAADADALEARIAEALAQRTRPGSRPEAAPNE